MMMVCVFVFVCMCLFDELRRRMVHRMFCTCDMCLVMCEDECVVLRRENS